MLQSWCGASTDPSFPSFPQLPDTDATDANITCCPSRASRGSLRAKGTGIGEGAKPGSRVSTGNGVGGMGRRRQGGGQSARGHRLGPAGGPGGLRGSPGGRLSWP